MPAPEQAIAEEKERTGKRLRTEDLSSSETDSEGSAKKCKYDERLLVIDISHVLFY